MDHDPPAAAAAAVWSVVYWCCYPTDVQSIDKRRRRMDIRGKKHNYLKRKQKEKKGDA